MLLALSTENTFAIIAGNDAHLFLLVILEGDGMGCDPGKMEFELHNGTGTTQSGFIMMSVLYGGEEIEFPIWFEIDPYGITNVFIDFKAPYVLLDIAPCANPGVSEAPEPIDIIVTKHDG